MAKKKNVNVFVDENSTYGKKAPVVINSQGTPEHKRDPLFTMSAHDKAEIFIAKMALEQSQHEEKLTTKSKSKISKITKKIRGVKNKKYRK